MVAAGQLRMGWSASGQFDDRFSTSPSGRRVEYSSNQGDYILDTPQAWLGLGCLPADCQIDQNAMIVLDSLPSRSLAYREEAEECLDEMGWAKPEYGKGQIDRAGRVIADPEVGVGDGTQAWSWSTTGARPMPSLSTPSK